MPRSTEQARPYRSDPAISVAAATRIEDFRIRGDRPNYLRAQAVLAAGRRGAADSKNGRRESSLEGQDVLETALHVQFANRR
jgi:hypothetical protein